MPWQSGALVTIVARNDGKNRDRTSVDGDMHQPRDKTSQDPGPRGRRGWDGRQPQDRPTGLCGPSQRLPNPATRCAASPPTVAHHTGSKLTSARLASASLKNRGLRHGDTVIQLL